MISSAEVNYTGRHGAALLMLWNSKSLFVNPRLKFSSQPHSTDRCHWMLNLIAIRSRRKEKKRKKILFSDWNGKQWARRWPRTLLLKKTAQFHSLPQLALIRCSSNQSLNKRTNLLESPLPLDPWSFLRPRMVCCPSNPLPHPQAHEHRTRDPHPAPASAAPAPTHTAR